MKNKEPEQKTQLSGQITEKLRGMILNGRFDSMQRLKEMEVASILGVSRTPIRHAFQILEKEGLITGIANKGYRINRLDNAFWEEMLDLRAILEGAAAGFSAEKGLTAEQSDRLQQCLNEGDQIIQDIPLNKKDIFSRYSKMNQLFHKTITNASGNRHLSPLLESRIIVPFRTAPLLGVLEEDERNREIIVAHSQHHAIVDALKKRQSGRAEAMMREHALAHKRWIPGVLNAKGLSDSISDFIHNRLLESEFENIE